MTDPDDDFTPGIRPAHRNTAVRLTTETKQAFKTTEFAVLVLVVLGVLIAAAVIGGDNTSRNGVEINHDSFPAVRAWLYVTIAAAAYMVSRGLAKAGSRDPYWAGDRDLPGHQESSHR